MTYRVSYKHNGQGNTGKITWGCETAHKSFKSINEAMGWIKAQAGIKPLKLLRWSDDVDCYETIKVF